MLSKCLVHGRPRDFRVRLRNKQAVMDRQDDEHCNIAVRPLKTFREAVLMSLADDKAMAKLSELPERGRILA